MSQVIYKHLIDVTSIIHYTVSFIRTKILRASVFLISSEKWAWYILSTFWEKRLEEHLHVSGLTGKPLTGMAVFAPLQHVKSGTCSVQKIFREDFSIIGHEKDPYLVQVKESIIIKTTGPKLNGNQTSVPIYMFWTQIAQIPRIFVCQYFCICDLLWFVYTIVS